jgi:hypothetical protein
MKLGAGFKLKPRVEVTKSGQSNTLPPAKELVSIYKYAPVRKVLKKFRIRRTYVASVSESTI